MPESIRLLRQLLGICLCLNVLGASDLPLKQITLYKHGIGFFEREGVVQAGEEARLDFRNTDMNDVLKSLIVTSAGGVGVSAVRYDSNATLEQQLGKYPFGIGNNELLSAFLDRLKGAHLEIKMGDRTASGAIVGARAITNGESDGRQAVNEQVTLLLDSGDVANFDLAAIGSMHLLDTRLQQQFKDYLETVAQSKAKDKRAIYLASAGSGERALRVSYIAPTAIWKSSYRLSLGTDKALLEGWATVDNTTDEDWTNVRLSVVSGRPISFISQLDTPRYGTREVVELPEDRAAGPTVYSGAIDGQAGDSLAKVPGAGLTLSEQMGLAQKDKAFFRTGGTHLGTGNAPPNGREFTNLKQYANLQSSIRSAAAGTLGELFEYKFAGPVTIKRNQSAMLPFLQDNIGARKLLIYQEVDGGNPVNAVEVSNNTGKTLDGGPITVFDAGAYAGEALVETLKTGDKRLIGYAIDYGSRVSAQMGASDNIVREISAKNGVLNLRVAEHRERTYTVRNVDSKPKTMLIEQAAADDFSVLSPTPVERTASAYRFEIAVPGSGSQSLTVKQERLITQQTAVTGATGEWLFDLVQNKKLSESGRRQLQGIVDLKGQIAASEAELDAAKSKIQNLTDEQNRLRQNIDSLNRVKGQEDEVRRYASQLSSNESTLAKLRDQRDAVSQRKSEEDDQLRQAISKLDF